MKHKLDDEIEKILRSGFQQARYRAKSEFFRDLGEKQMKSWQGLLKLFYQIKNSEGSVLKKPRADKRYTRKN